MTATGAAYAAMADQAFAFWNEAFQAVIPEPSKPQPKSWYVEPAPAKCGVAEAWPGLLPWMWMDIGAVGSVKPRAVDNDPFSISAWVEAPVASWLELTKPQTAMACPMAFGMISAGIPPAVAWPTARANVAAMDACSVVAQSVQTAIENYQSVCSHH